MCQLAALAVNPDSDADRIRLFRESCLLSARAPSVFAAMPRLTLRKLGSAAIPMASVSKRPPSIRSCGVVWKKWANSLQPFRSGEVS